MPKRANYTQVRVYHTAKKLLLITTVLTKNFPREYRFSVGQDLYRSIIDFIIMIYDTYTTSNFKLQYDAVSKLKRQVQYINIYLRLSSSLHLFSKERYIELTQMTADCDNQLTCWQLSIKRKIKEYSNEPTQTC